ncbi:MAG: GumC family protein [Sphingomicrobium sp.]
MLDRQTFTERQLEEEQGLDISPAYIWELVKRRSVWFAIPFLTLFVIGSFVALKWPAEYLSAGKILVLSPEIPTELVRPTVVSLANERIQVIQQRIMTRENLLNLAKKYSISAGWRAQIAGTEIVDFIRDRTVLFPVETKAQNDRKQAIAFTVGFEYENPLVAMKVANEIMTMILSEDAKGRTANASETTKFLQDNVQRLEAQLSSLDHQIVTIRAGSLSVNSGVTNPDTAKELASLRSQLLVKRATFSDSHPAIRALKRQIELLEKGEPATSEASDKADDAKDGKDARLEAIKGRSVGLDALETKRASVKKELDEASQKLATAKLGETLERGQHSERLEVIEQATMPTKSTKPNRFKLFGFAVAFAMMMGGVAAAGSEFLDKSIRRGSDLQSVVDARMIVAIPYIATRKEVRHVRRARFMKIGSAAALAAGAIAIAYFYVPDPEILLDKALKALLG